MSVLWLGAVLGHPAHGPAGLIFLSLGVKGGKAVAEAGGPAVLVPVTPGGSAEVRPLFCIGALRFSDGK